MSLFLYPWLNTLLLTETDYVFCFTLYCTNPRVVQASDFKPVGVSGGGGLNQEQRAHAASILLFTCRQRDLPQRISQRTASISRMNHDGRTPAKPNYYATHLRYVDLHIVVVAHVSFASQALVNIVAGPPSRSSTVSRTSFL